MKILCTAATICAVATGAAADPRPLSGEEINNLLPQVIVRGITQDTLQTFEATGRTEYIAGGRPSVGAWWVTATQYCSSWPPASGRACYDVLYDDSNDPARLTWIGQSGENIHNTTELKEIAQ